MREGIAHRCGVGDVAFESKRGAADRLGLCLRGGLVDIEQRHFGAGRRERLCRCKADGARGAGDGDNLPRQRQLLGAAELRLLERPVFDVEQIGLRQRLEAADGLRIGDGGNRGLGEVGGDARVLLAAAEPEQADAGHQHHARRGIEHGLDPADAGVVAGKIVPVGFAVGRDGVADRVPEAGEVAILGRGNHQRLVLDADVVIRRHHAGLAIARHLRAVDKIHHRIASRGNPARSASRRRRSCCPAGCRRRGRSARRRRDAPAAPAAWRWTSAGLRFFASRSSARLTSAIMRS